MVSPPGRSCPEQVWTRSCGTGREDLVIARDPRCGDGRAAGPDGASRPFGPRPRSLPALGMRLRDLRPDPLGAWPGPPCRSLAPSRAKGSVGRSPLMLPQAAWCGLVFLNDLVPYFRPRHAGTPDRKPAVRQAAGAPRAHLDGAGRFAMPFHHDVHRRSSRL